MADQNTKPAVKPFNFKPVQTTTGVSVIKPTQPKEVKPVAKDKTGMFDYSNCKQYVVKHGQDLLDVANEVLVAYEQLRYFNHLSKNNPHVHEGQVLYIPNKAVDVPLGK